MTGLGLWVLPLGADTAPAARSVGDLFMRMVSASVVGGEGGRETAGTTQAFAYAEGGTLLPPLQVRQEGPRGGVHSGPGAPRLSSVRSKREGLFYLNSRRQASNMFIAPLWHRSTHILTACDSLGLCGSTLPFFAVTSMWWTQP